ncbi:MAG: hypothetical protein GY699_17285 [Desulfobacteraceae bacterium]|nr:hypothetical protein [Desulfobacteraceae bacterium]
MGSYVNHDPGPGCLCICFGKIFFSNPTRVETLLFWLAATGLFWQTYWADAAGFIALSAACVFQGFYHVTPNTKPRL